MYIPFMLLLRLHFLLMYFIHIDGTITLTQISLSSAPSGMLKFCFTNEKSYSFSLVGNPATLPSVTCTMERGIACKTDQLCQQSLLALQSTSSSLKSSSCSLFACVLYLQAPLPTP